ncbi:hypothetical protein SMF913_27503 [Streptomyces malaysiensis]|uniref:Uncharacterized protein n=1 Tax=Streptomyces malaysiensis TaxID=92644 RepID=A0A2J7YVI4_STRMQ|nr:hypothetical protein SMF913_27503 [Streptomyces malaysiensis]
MHSPHLGASFPLTHHSDIRVNIRARVPLDGQSYADADVNPRRDARTGQTAIREVGGWRARPGQPSSRVRPPPG